MSMKMIEKKQKRAQVAKEARELLDQAEKRGGMNQEDETVWNRMMGEVDKLGSEIEREERLQHLESDLESRDGSSAKYVDAEEKRELKPAIDRKEYRQAFHKFLTDGMAELDNEERSLLLQGKSNEQRALSSVTGASGGFTVPVGFYNQLLETMKSYGGMRQSRATVLQTSGGNVLQIPKVDDTANIGSIVGENAPVGNATDPTFSSLSLGAYKYTSKVILVPIELLQDSAFHVENYIREALATRIGRVTNAHFTTGTGSGQPSGVVTGASQGAVGATGATTSLVSDSLFDLIHSVDPAYRTNSAQFMFHDSTLKVIRKLKDADGRYVWEPSLRVGEPDRILGYEYVINQDVPVMAANAKSILFGDMSRFYIRDVMDLSVYRLGEKYLDQGCVGFLTFSRHDSVLTDVNAIKFYQNSDK
ncbi:phage major capsid protein [Thermoactinomyces sp. DSM 45892]|uniref:phage major capsid protein n=1 Tax=Thermoactinomyces sp. DSM 45892 TaxID=1882753 RepID=UPI00089D39ED|nr:phage major capsid protein [Thermoactinomyces sp. DSM 45892]SDY69344.1 phage major capsid protein, HK97 family [Thermoactinomyces sp. DSM 45892]